MKCKSCGAEIAENCKFCTECGQAQDSLPEEEYFSPEAASDAGEAAASGEAPAAYAPQEAAAQAYDNISDAPAPAAAPQRRRLGAGGIVAIVLAVLALASAAVLYFRTDLFRAKDSGDKAPDNTELSENVDKPAETDEDTAAEALKVAAEMNGHELTNSRLAFYYMDEFYYLYDYYGEYLMSVLDTSVPFDEQFYPNSETETWHDHFLNSALNTWSQTVRLCDEAEKEGFTLDGEYAAELDGLYADMSADADGSYDSVDEYVKSIYGKYADFDGYYEYRRNYFTAISFVNSKHESFTAEAEAAVGDDDSDTVYYANVRHILIMPEDNSDEALKAAEAKASELYAQWQENATEDSFAALAAENSHDPGSAANGGLYEDVYPGQMVPEFNDWCFDASRQPGDHGIVKTDYGYHIMYYVSKGGVYQSAALTAASEAYRSWLEGVFSDIDYTTHEENISVSTDAF